MAEALCDNLENVRFMALHLRGELDDYTHVRDFADMFFASGDDRALERLRRIQKCWGEMGIKSPPDYVPVANIPTCDEIAQMEDPEQLDRCVDKLMNALRFLRLMGCAENKLPSVSGLDRINIEINGTDIDVIETASEIVRNSIIRLLPFDTSTAHSSLGDGKGTAREIMSFKYIEGYERDLQEAVVRTRIAIIAQNMDFDFNADKMLITFD